MPKMYMYENLKTMMKEVKPIKSPDLPDRWPMTIRSQGYKYFFPVEKDGKTEFHVGYYFGTFRRTITQAEYKALSKNQKKKCFQSRDDGINNTWTYFSRTLETDWIIRDDNTIEFMNGLYGQGTRMFFNDVNLSSIYIGDYRNDGLLVAHDVKKGGPVVTAYIADKPKHLPIFAGMRFNYLTGQVHESSRYTFTTKEIDRAKSKEGLKSYREAFKIAKIFLSPLDYKQLTEALIVFARKLLNLDDGTLLDIYDRTRPINDGKSFFEKFYKDNLKDNPVEAVMAGMIANATVHLNRRWYTNMDTAKELTSSFRKLERAFKKQNSDIFVEKTYTDENSLKSCEWGLKIKVNGVEL